MNYVSEPTAPTMRTIGNRRSGIIEVPEYGYLTTDEDDLINELLADEPNPFVAAAKLSQAISVEEEIDILEAYQVVERSVTGQDMEPAAEAIKVKHAERIEGIVRIHREAGGHRIRASVTAILRQRLNVQEIPPNWPRALYQGIYQLVLDEQTAENQPADEVTSDGLGKPPEVTASGSEPTGPASSGS